MSMEGEFRSHHESTWHQSFSTISLICALFSPRFWYVIAETMGYQNGVLCFSIRCWDHIEIFNRKLKLKIFEGIIRWCVRSIRIIRWYVTKSTYHLLISSRFLFIYLFILPRICSQDISRTDKPIVMNFSTMIDLSLT